MRVRLATREDAATWSAMRRALWPDADADALRAEAGAFFDAREPLLNAVWLCEDAGQPLGMLEP